MPNPKPVANLLLKAPVNDAAIHRLLDRLNYSFKQGDLLTLALSHRSVGKTNNERLEFLGDALLNAFIAEALFHRFPAGEEGQLSRMRAQLVKGETLAKIAKEFSLGEYLKLGEGELKSGGFRRSSILADAVEAVIGAIYLDSDFNTCRRCVLNWYQSRLDELSLATPVKDPKTELQEFLQARSHALPVYKVINTEGQAHAQTFTVSCKVELLSELISAQGKSRREAEKQAAAAVLRRLKEQ